MSRFRYIECNPYAVKEHHPDQTVTDLHYLGLIDHFYVRWNPDPPKVKPPSWVARVERARAFIRDWDARQHTYTQDELRQLVTAYQEQLT